MLAGCAAPAPHPAARLKPAGDGPAGLVGATSAKIQAEFGRPLLLRRDGPAEVWLYRSQTCTVDLILYPDPHTGMRRVAVANVLPLGAPRPASECLADLGGAESPPAGQVASGGL